MLVNAGQEVTAGLMSQLRNFALLEGGVAQPLMVRSPAAGSVLQS
jgi:hypothetical protein